MRVWSTVAELLAAHGACALVTVATVRGSAAREPGARMVIEPHGGFRGTIGGGELEWRAIGAARDALSLNEPEARLDHITLGPDLGQCCGGTVRLLTEVFDRDRLDEVRALAAREAAGPFSTRGQVGQQAIERIVEDDAEPAGPTVELADDGTIVERFRDARRPVWLFGAGHVGRALMLALAPLPFDVTWIDAREDAFPRAVPANVRAVQSTDGAAEVEVSRCGDDAVPVLGVRGTAWCGASTAHSRHSGALRYPGDPDGYANGRAASSRFQGQRPSQ